MTYRKPKRKNYFKQNEKIYDDVLREKLQGYDKYI